MRFLSISAFASVCFLSSLKGEVVGVTSAVNDSAESTLPSKTESDSSEPETKKPDRISLEIQKGDRLAVKGVEIPLFYLSAEGLSVGKKFKIANRNALGRTIVVFEGLYLGRGRMSPYRGTNFRGNLVESFLPIKVGGFAEGERSEYLLMDEKENVLNSVTYLPRPLEVVAEDGATLSLSLVGEYQYECACTSLQPNEEITIISTSGPERGEIPFAASPEGIFIGSINPKVIGMDSAKCNFTIQRKAHSLSLDYSYSSVPESLKPDTPIVVFTIDHSPSTEELQELKVFLEKN